MDDTFSNRWDEIWVYAPALTEMAEIGPTLLPGVLDAELSRGHPLLFHFLIIDSIQNLKITLLSSYEQ